MASATGVAYPDWWNEIDKQHRQMLAPFWDVSSALFADITKEQATWHAQNFQDASQLIVIEKAGMSIVTEKAGMSIANERCKILRFLQGEGLTPTKKWLPNSLVDRDVTPTKSEIATIASDFKAFYGKYLRPLNGKSDFDELVLGVVDLTELGSDFRIAAVSEEDYASAGAVLSPNISSLEKALFYCGTEPHKRDSLKRMVQDIEGGRLALPQLVAPSWLDYYHENGAKKEAILFLLKSPELREIARLAGLWDNEKFFDAYLDNERCRQSIKEWSEADAKNFKAQDGSKLQDLDSEEIAKKVIFFDTEEEEEEDEEF